MPARRPPTATTRCRSRRRSGQGSASTHHFYRLLGDVDGSGTVDQLDLTDIAAARGQSVSQIAAAINQPASGLAAAEHGRQRRRLGQQHRPAARDEVQGECAEEADCPWDERSTRRRIMRNSIDDEDPPLMPRVAIRCLPLSSGSAASNDIFPNDSLGSSAGLNGGRHCPAGRSGADVRAVAARSAPSTASVLRGIRRDRLE